ncbi:glycosyltransferase, partial [Candidatus Sumerlaeota bacterium]|nr:glycosyltransferase [Candidatus Sumerlaeota bacterium]
MADQQPEISIIIPTYNERDSIAAVVRDVCAVAAQRRYAIEIIIVDDNSPDGTGGEAERLAKHFPVCVVHRERKLGLGSAVVEGFSRARGRIWGLMDGDGSHPADALPDLIEPIRQGNRQIALASRYVAGGGVEYWPWHRWVLSFVATMLGRLFVPVRDPLSGFIFLDRSVIEGIPLNVTGYKIGLEILIKGRYELLVEIPYTFRNRGVGRSKLGWSEYVNYLRSLVSHTVHVVTHRAEGRAKRRAHRFATLGETGRPADATNKGAEVQAKRLWGPCPLCGADNSQFMFFKSTYRHVRCGTCGLVFVNPMPPPDELEAIYQDPRYFANRNEWTYGYNDYFEEGRFYRALFERRVSQCEEAIGAEEGSARRLLDVGCAAGFLLEVARARGWDIAGVEISTHAAGVANERLGGAVRCGTLEQARFADRSFDCVVMLDIVEHVGDPLGLLREAARA